MKHYKGEYIIKMKVSNITMSDDHTEQELKSKIKEKAREGIVSYLNGYLFDPNGRVFEQEITFEEI